MWINDQKSDELISVHIPDKLSDDMLKRWWKWDKNIKTIFEVVWDMKDDIAKKIDENKDKKKS